MANFICCDREQVFLLPPSLREWVPEDFLVWTVLGAAEEMDLGAFYCDHRADGHGRPAYEPSMMVALLLYAYARGNRSSRGIERACVEEVAHRVVAGNLVPDHSTIADFRVRHEAALAELFTGVLGLCRRAGLVSVGVVAIDGTRVAANASRGANYQPPTVPAGKVNTTDHDSRLMKTVGPAMQGYNAQAAVNENQIVVAAEVTVDPPDFGHLEPMVDATVRELAAVGAKQPETVVADAGYWHKHQMEAVVSRGMQVLIPPDAGLRKNTRPGWDGGLYAFMRRVLQTEQGKALYRKRKATVEPVFGQMKFNRRFDRFQHRGRAACRSEWRLFGASHNLLKLHTDRIAAAGA